MIVTNERVIRARRDGCLTPAVSGMIVLHGQSLDGQQWQDRARRVETAVDAVTGCGNPLSVDVDRDIQPGWVIEKNRSAQGIGIRIDIASEPDRVAFYVSTNSRVIIPEVVLMQSRLPIEDLSGEAQVVGKCIEIVRFSLDAH